MAILRVYLHDNSAAVGVSSFALGLVFDFDKLGVCLSGELEGGGSVSQNFMR